MMGVAEIQNRLFHTVRLEELVPANHPFRKIHPLVDKGRIRELCKGSYCQSGGRDSVPPEQLFLALLGGYLLGCRSERKIIMELQCNMAFRWFVGLDIDSKVWDRSTFSKNRERFDGTDVFEKLFDDTVDVAIKQGWVSLHWSVDGTLVRANASIKSFVPMEVLQRPAEFRKNLTAEGKKENEPANNDDDKGNPSVDFRGEKRSNKTHRSTTDEDARFATKSSKDGALPSYVVNGVMENRNRFLVGIGVEVFDGHAERDGAISLLDRAKDRFEISPDSLGADKAYFEEKFLQRLLDRKIDPHIAVQDRGSQLAHTRVRMRQRGMGYQLSQRARKKIEELWGEGKDWHGLRRFARRTILKVRQEAWMIGWLLNLKRLARMEAMAAA